MGLLEDGSKRQRSGRRRRSPAHRSFTLARGWGAQVESPAARLLPVSTHIGAEPGEIAPTVLMPGDPLRAKWIAETFLDDATCYSEVRGMLGYTGTWQGQPGLRAGLRHGPAVARDLRQRAVQRVRRAAPSIRVGSCGALTEKLGAPRRRDRLRRLHRLVDEPAPVPRPRLRAGRRLRPAGGGVRRGAGAGRRHHARRADLLRRPFYNPRAELMKPMVEHGVLAVEMEASALYTLAAQYGAPRAGDLHRLRPHRHRRGRPPARSASRRSARWSTSRSPPRCATDLSRRRSAPARPGRAARPRRARRSRRCARSGTRRAPAPAPPRPARPRRRR